MPLRVAVTALWNPVGVIAVAVDRPPLVLPGNLPAKSVSVQLDGSPALSRVNHNEQNESWVRPCGVESWVGIPAYAPHSILPLTPRVTFALYPSSAFDPEPPAGNGK